jgi:uncharacterized protein YdeI (YjbR/CyaY-like superfamily)
MVTPTFFADQAKFREWLGKYHHEKTELLVGFYKVHTNKPSMTWPESVDQALCFGWIDGIRKSIDHESYCIRFTPRKKNSNWSAVNIKKVEKLTREGLMKQAGLEAFANRKEEKSEIYSFEANSLNLNNIFEKRFKSNGSAWTFFNQQSASYRKTVIHWIMSAKQEKTQLSRLEKAIAESEKHQLLWNNFKTGRQQNGSIT